MERTPERRAGGLSYEWVLAQDAMKRRLGALVRKRRSFVFKGPVDVHHESYKRFRMRILQGGAEGPAASTPLPTRGRYEPDYEFDGVCQRLDLDSPPRPSTKEESTEYTIEEGTDGRQLEGRGVSVCGAITPPYVSQTVSAGRCPIDVPEQGWTWTSGQGDQNSADSGNPQPFSALCKASMSPPERAMMKMAAPSLQNDYYTSVLDCSCNGMVALALGSCVYIWNSDTHTQEGFLHPGPPALTQARPEPLNEHSRAVSCLCWSADGSALCIGDRQGAMQLWDVEYKRSVRCLPPHLSVVGAISWKQHLLSSGSDLGRIHHYDLRALAPLVGARIQQGAVCSLQWSPGDDRLASGSRDGHLHIWDSDITGLSKTGDPIVRMTQPSSVKAMGWCPWQRHLIVTGGGWRDGELRLWDVDSGTCISSAHTHSQICSLRWSEKRRALLTGHGLPHHSIMGWRFSPLTPILQLTGHTHRVLHLALNAAETQLFSAGADQSLHIWTL